MTNPYKKYSKINPQRGKGHGHREIANDVFKALIAANLTAAQYKLILCIIDFTWGFNKNSTPIAASQIMEATRLAERTVRQGLLKLKSRRFISYGPSKKVHRGAPLNEYFFNKHYDTWVVDNPESYPQKGELSTEKKGAQPCIGAQPRRKGCTVVQPSVLGKGAQPCTPIKKERKVIKKEYLYKNNSTKNKDFNTLVEKTLGRMAKKEQIQNVLGYLDKKNWSKVKAFLSFRYRDGVSAYESAVSEMNKKV